MQRWIVAALFIVAGPLHAASDLETLLAASMLDAENPALPAWTFDVEAARGVAWAEDGAEWSKERNAYARTGRVELAWPGAEGTPLDGLSWQLTLLGGRWGPTQLEIDSVGNLPELQPGLPELAGLSVTPQWCDSSGGATFGTRVYMLEAPGKQPAFLRHEWSCGSAGCAVVYRLYLHEREIQDFVKAVGMTPCDQLVEEQTGATTPFSAEQIWKGEYVCGQGATQLELKIAEVRGPEVTAIFDFLHAPSGTTGRFYVHGTYQPELRRIAFEGGEWIARPEGYGVVGLLGHLDVEGRALVGVVDSRGCGAFLVSR